MPLSSHCWLLQAGEALDASAVTRFKETLYPAIMESLDHFGPEFQVVIAAIAILLLDLCLPVKVSKHLAWVAIGACLLPLSSIAHHYHESHDLFLGMVKIDPMANFFKAFFLIGSVPVILLSYLSKNLQGRSMGEYYFLLLASVFGGMLMASATHFLTLFLSLEILSVCSYVLVGYVRRERRGAEAALKYIIYGSIAAALMGYGFSLWYGMTGSGSIAELAQVIWNPDDAVYTERAMLQRTMFTVVVSMLMIFAGFAYKMAALPMHFWAPDVYDGAPTVVTAFLSVLSKAAGFAIGLRFFGALADSVNSLNAGELSQSLWGVVEWQHILIVVSILTMTLGNLAALWQTNIKRMMAYSSIAHAGYLMMGLTVLGHATQYTGPQSIAYYLAAFLAMNFGVFAVLIIIENRTGSVDIAEYGGMGRRAPLLAASLTLFLFSLIGVPPTAGFLGKFHLLMGVIELGGTLESGWYYGLALAAIVNTAISAYYYLKITKVMYLERSEDTEPVPSPFLGHAVVVGMVILTIYLFVQADVILKTTLQL